MAQSPDIRKLQLFPEGIYYLGFGGNAGEKKDEYRCFRLFFFDMRTKNTLNLVETYPYAELFLKTALRSELLGGRSVHTSMSTDDLDLWDFYRTKQGTLANLSIVSASAGHGRAFDWFGAALYCISPKQAVPYSDFAPLGAFPLNQLDLEPRHRKPLSQGTGHPQVAAYDQLLFSAEAEDRFMSLSRYNEAWESFSVTDQKKNLLVMDTDAIYRLYGQVSRHRTVDGFHQGGVLAHVANEMILMTGDFQDTVRSVLLEGEEAIRFVVAGGLAVCVPIQRKGQPGRAEEEDQHCRRVRAAGRKAR